VFEIVGDITNVQVIATGRGIRRLPTLGKRRRAEIHWYEAHGVGKRGLKIKRFLD
jgi:hypothetical protein